MRGTKALAIGWVVLGVVAGAAACTSGTTTGGADVGGDGAGVADSLCFCSADSDCDDGNPCTRDFCTESCTCGHEKLGGDTVCTSDNACLMQGTCYNGKCVAEGTVECVEQDGNPCTEPQCDPKAEPGTDPCLEEPVEDGAVITTFCSQRVCEGGTVKETTPTPEAVACEQADDRIDPSGCIESRACVDSEKACVGVPREDGAPCSQGTNKCLGYSCKAGECVADTELDVVCDPPSECQDAPCLACTQFKCDPKDGACKATKLTDPCDDGNPCTQGDVCADGTNPMYGMCKGSPKLCDDGKVCTVDSCDPMDGHCGNEPKNENCPGSNNPCVSQIFCDPFAGEAADPNLDGCVVVYKPMGTPCNDGDSCTTGESCSDQNGALLCVGFPLDVDDGNPCTNDWCDPVAGPKHELIPDCDAPCAPGEQMQGPCGNCGIHTRTCPPSGKWKDAVWGPCLSEKDCTPGVSETVKCGNCGTQERQCLDTCVWSGWGACLNEGECTPGESQFEACGGVCNNKQRTCSSECQWGIWGDCVQKGDCTPGITEWQTCGKCGQQSHTCTDGCVWGAWGNCQNEGECSVGQTQSQPCGNCGTQTRTCTGQCQWGAWGTCQNQGVCVPNQSETQSCGNCGTKSHTCTGQCQWGTWSSCTDPCQCQCAGGTCCSNGCSYDPVGTSCGPCKQCNASGSCSVNKADGTSCTGGVCSAGACVQCISGKTESCDPNCGVFSNPADGLRKCVNNVWEQCKPAWCKDTQSPVLYKAAPMDHDWHCGYVAKFNMYLCVKVVLSWICADYLEIDLMKSWNVYGTDETGPWDNDIKVVLRNVDTGKTVTQSKVQCKGNTSTSGGCFFDVGTSDFFSKLGLSGTDKLEVDIYSPYDVGPLIGTTGQVSIQQCY